MTRMTIERIRPGGADRMGDDSYIVRIYRRDRTNPRLVAGTVEEVGVEGKKGFGSFEELRGILSDPKRKGKGGSSAAGRRKQKGGT